MQPTYTMPDFNQAFLCTIEKRSMSATFTQFRTSFAPQLNFVTNPARFLHILCLFLYKFLQTRYV